MRKMTRNTLRLFLSMILLLSLPTFCFADSLAYITEYGVTVTLPEESYVVTQSTSASDEFWDLTGIDCDSFLEELKAEDIFLIAIPEDGEYEVDVYCEEGDNFRTMFDLAQFENSDLLESLTEGLLEDVEGTDIEVSDFDIYETGELKFFAFTRTVDYGSEVERSRSYMTIHNGIRFLFVYVSTYGTLTEQDEINIRSIVDGMEFDTHLDPPLSSRILKNIL